MRKEKTKVSRISGFCKHAGLAELADADLQDFLAGTAHAVDRPLKAECELKGIMKENDKQA